jgi:hypothetical protein
MAAMCLAVPSYGGNIFVDVSASPGGDGTRPNTPFDTITAGVNAANSSPGSTIMVKLGTYKSQLVPGGKENFGSNGITITAGPTVIQGGFDSGWAPHKGTSIIDLSNATTRAFYDTYGGGLVTFDGFTFKNASHTNDGGAIGGWGKGFTVVNCTFTNNRTTARGGAVSLGTWGLFGVGLTNCAFYNNHADHEGGACYVESSGSSPGVSNCSFYGNSCGTEGGAIFIWLHNTAQDHSEIRLSQFVGNMSDGNGGAIFSHDGFDGTTFSIQQCILTGNSAPNGAAIGGDSYWQGGYVIGNCLIQSNLGGFAVMSVTSARVDTNLMDIAYCTIVDNPGGGVSCIPSQNNEHTNQIAALQFGLRIRDSIIIGNGQVGINYSRGIFPPAAIQYSDVYGHTIGNYWGDAVAGAGCISVDPRFGGRATGDFRLRNSSPCEGSATNIGIGYDIQGVTRPRGSGYSMGCYETPNVPSGTLLIVR